uniref:HTH_48 domain-containing protein n=1 Tax=Haemonchus contortus TaxID=6289 RepID=A0A7I4YE66_HAECO
AGVRTYVVMFLDMQIRICVLYEYKLNRNVPVAFENLSRAFGDGAISRESVYRWYHRFRKGNENLEDERGPFSIIDDDELKKVVEENPNLSLRELANRFGVGRTAIRYHLDKIANGKRVRYDAKKAEDAKKRKQGKTLEDDEKASSSPEGTEGTPPLEASVKKEDGTAAPIVRVGQPQDSKQEIPTASTREEIDTIQNDKEADESIGSNSSQHDVCDQEIGVINLNHVGEPRETKECITYLF